MVKECTLGVSPVGITPTGSTTACSRSPPRGAIVAASTYALSLSSLASSAAASHRTRIIFDTCSHGRSAVRPAMNSRCRFAASITAPFIARATSEDGGTPPASTQSKSPEALETHACERRADSAGRQGARQRFRSNGEECWPKYEGTRVAVGPARLNLPLPRPYRPNTCL